MPCYQHPEIDSVGNCVGCGRSLCRSCQTNYNDRSYCSDCFEKALVGAAQIPIVSGVSASQKNWFQRHLNWTLIFGGWAAAVVFFIVAIILGVVGIYDYLPGIGSSILNILIFLVVSYFHVGWYLRQKNRSLLWLLIWWIPFGALVILCLTNKSPDVYDAIHEKEIQAQKQEQQRQADENLKQLKEKFPNKTFY